MSRKLNYIWRLIATAISFTTFGLGGVFLTLVVFPLLNLTCRSVATRKKIARKIIHRSFRFFVNMMSFFGMFHFDFKQAEKKLKNSQGKILIANHPTLIDVVVLISILPHADCIVKKSLWNNPFLKGVVTAADYIKNTQNVEELLRVCDNSLKANYTLIIFPEGTRSQQNKEIKLQRGASNIALRCNVDIIPVIIRCEPSTLSKNEPWYSIPSSKARFSLKTGPELSINEFQKTEQSQPLRARALTSSIKQYFNKELRNYA